MQVVWKGPFFDITGYGAVARGYVDSLDRMGVNIRVIIERRGFPGLIPAGLRERIYRLAQRPAEKPSRTVFIRHSIPDRFERMGSFSMGVTAWETDRIHPLWRDWCNAMDAVGVPSRMNVESFIAGGLNRPVELLRYGIDQSFLNPGAVHDDPLAGRNAPPFRFLSVFDWVYRKGYDVLFRAFWEEFNRGDGVCLVIKTGHGSFNAGTGESILGEMKRLGEKIGPRGNAAPVFFFAGNTDTESLIRLYKSCHCFVLPSRGEGAGLPLLEAGALGMPVISTGWGGQTDFLDEDNSFPVEYTLSPVPIQRHCPYYQPDQLWAEPDPDDLRKKMRWVLENHRLSLERGSRLRDFILSRYTWDRAAGDVIDAVRKVAGIDCLC
ncbi:MAG: glycosyltransferase family 4 protein [Bacillota bacterium]